jgi:nickel/cobalt transporter (NicO) family protein
VGRAFLATAVALAALVMPAVAGAHPLGNFTINHYSRVQPTGDRIYVVYVLDMAEIPTFRVRRTMSTPEAYARATSKAVADELELEVAGRRLDLAPVRHAIAFPPGVGGLDTLRLEIVLRSPRLPPATAPETLSYRDGTFRGRIGWKEVVLRAAGDARVSASSVPSKSISGELLAYPKNLLQSPSDVTSATASFVPGTEPGPAPQLPSRTALAQRVTVRTPPDSGFASLVAHRGLGPGFLLLSLGIALFWGAAHAFSPGHGKAIVAGYLVGTRGRIRDAVALGLIVTFTHTIGVFALGGVTLLLSQFIVPEELYPWLNLASAILVVAVGVGILRWRVSAWRGRSSPGGSHNHAAGHEHHHHHHHDHGHHHGDGDREHGKRSGLLGIGVSAGILPCPTALVVLLAAISLHRVGYGLVLILAFSMGLALAVTSIGLIAVLARRTFGRTSLDGSVVRALPAVSALVVLGLGVAMTVRALPRVL